MTLEEKITYITSLGYSDNEILVKHSLLRTEELILNYLNLNKLPKGATYTHIDMATMHLENQLSLITKPSEGENESLGKVGSIQEGDTTIKMATARDTETTLDKSKAKRIFEDNLINDFKIALHKFRKMRW